ncbi:phytoene desaturase family protein [Arundinibacter roseus]|uniref:NAD(P)/FAD-dependent oxidoreductase n=1 Tax=Arundinibacter roseus TaxID=2070510 RepID=A0A4R4KDJ8_9BACT|nr:NAD(P)/FAD-dependent oxidoreductase [Arundinibacter roseus]TDB65970.1 NAD(P)/FAD-dependent oxidoreductase [Arundinibacter roseus]
MNGLSSSYDVIIIGGGHNGLVTANYLAKAGKRVLVLEKNDYFGGATTSKRIFPDYDARLSQYSYLISLFPKQIRQELGLSLNLLPRRIASYTPFHSAQGLLLPQSNPQATREAILGLGFGESEYVGYQRIMSQQSVFADLVWDSFLEPLKSRSTFEKQFQQAGQQGLWQSFVEEPIGNLLDKNLQSDILRGVLMTDAKIGAFTSAYDESLLQNRTFLYHVVGNKTGEWRVPEGGMGFLVEQLVQKAVQYGATLRMQAAVKAIHLGNTLHEVAVEMNGVAYTFSAKTVISNASVVELRRLLDHKPEPSSVQDEGTAFKINMLLKKLPALKQQSVRPEDAFAGTFHINQSFSQMEKTFAEANQTELPQTLAGEMYCHTLTDPSILSPELQREGYHTLTYFGLDLPYRLFLQDNEGTRQEVVRRFLDGLNEYLVEPLEDCLARDAQGNLCLEAKSALDLENDLSLPKGNIFHDALTWFFAENETETGTWGVETPWERILICGSSAKRGGAVSGIPGRNAAMKVLGR